MAGLFGAGRRLWHSAHAIRSSSRPEGQNKTANRTYSRSLRNGCKKQKEKVSGLFLGSSAEAEG
jgi:hypothetical protein